MISKALTWIKQCIKGIKETFAVITLLGKLAIYR